MPRATRLSHKSEREFHVKRALVLFVLLLAARSAQAHDFKSCKPVGTQCVGIVDDFDGDFWIANRIRSDNGRYMWVNIKRADCPNAHSRHDLTFHAFDPVYGDYECRYDAVVEHGDDEPVSALRESGLHHYVRRHKTLLATDAVLMLSSLAEAASTEHCLQANGSCMETNPLLRGHPSAAQLYGLKISLTSAIIFTNHLWVSRIERTDSPVYELWTVPLVIMNGIAASNNIRVAEQGSAAQARAAARARLAH
jgi:hypothetical protein